MKNHWEKVRFSTVNKAYLHRGKTIFKNGGREYYMPACAEKILNTQQTVNSGCLLGKGT